MHKIYLILTSELCCCPQHINQDVRIIIYKKFMEMSLRRHKDFKVFIQRQLKCIIHEIKWLRNKSLLWQHNQRKHHVQGPTFIYCTVKTVVVFSQDAHTEVFTTTESLHRSSSPASAKPNSSGSSHSFFSTTDRQTDKSLRREMDCHPSLLSITRSKENGNEMLQSKWRSSRTGMVYGYVGSSVVEASPILNQAYIITILFQVEFEFLF